MSCRSFNAGGEEKKLVCDGSREPFLPEVPSLTSSSHIGANNNKSVVAPVSSVKANSLKESVVLGNLIKEKIKLMPFKTRMNAIRLLYKRGLKAARVFQTLYVICKTLNTMTVRTIGNRKEKLAVVQQLQMNSVQVSKSLNYKEHRLMVAELLGRNLSEKEFEESYRPYGCGISRRFYVNITSTCNRATTAIIDSASDVTLISINVLRNFTKDWQGQPSAGKVKLVSHSQDEIPVGCTRWIKVYFGEDIKPFLIKVAVTLDSDEFLLGADFLQEHRLGLMPEGKHYNLVFPAALTHSGKGQQVPVHTTPRHKLGSSTQSIFLDPKGTDFVKFSVPSNFQTEIAVITQVSSKGINAEKARFCTVFPSLCPVKSHETTRYVRALVVNQSDKSVELLRGDLYCSLEEIDPDEYYNVPAEALQDCPEILQGMIKQIKLGNLPMVRQVAASETLDETDPLEIEDYFESTDRLDMNQTIGEDALMGPEEIPAYVKDKIPYKDIPPEYWWAVDRLFLEKYPKLLARSQYDAGDISKTLGYLYIPLSGKLPQSTKLYYSNAQDMAMMHDILQSLVRHNIIAKSNSAFGAPCFLIRRKNGQTPMRFLSAVCDLNDVVAKPISVLPNITRVLESLSSKGVGLASSLDLSSGFYALSIYPPHQSRCCILTPYGTFKYLRTPMGFTSAPTIYAQKVNEGIHTDPCTGLSDVIDGVIPFLDDIPILTMPMADKQAEFNLHYQTLDKVLHRLNVHNFRVSPEKLSLFQKDCHLLGHILSNGEIRVDPKRIDKMLKAPDIKTKRDAQVWLGFIASIKHFAPPLLAKAAAVLSELTGKMEKFEVLPRHHEAMQAIREILASTDFVIAVPDNRKVRVLFTDSSSLCVSAVLLEADLELEITRNEFLTEKAKTFSDDDIIGRLNTAANLNLALSAHESVSEGDCYYEVLIDQLELLGMKNFATRPYELRMSIVSSIDNSVFKPVYRSLVEKSGQGWFSFLEKHSQKRQPPDAFGIIYSETARLLERDVLFVVGSLSSKSKVVRYKGGSNASRKPPIWMAIYPPPAGYPFSHARSLICMAPNEFSEFVTGDVVTTDVHDMTQQEIMTKVKEIFQITKKPKIKLKVIAYYSKVIAKEDRQRAIHELELMALINSLNSFREYLVLAPAVVTMIDSRTAYFLLNRCVSQSALKIRRWSVMLQTAYPNLLLHLVPSEKNWSDVFSRLFEMPPKIHRALKLKGLDLHQIPELDYKFLTMKEVEEFSEFNNDFLIEAPEDKDCLNVSAPAVCAQILSKHAMEVLNNFTTPVRILAERLSDANVSRAQRELLPFYKEAKRGQHKDLGITFRNALLLKEGRIYIPKILEGVLLAYLHLTSGHSGHEKLLGKLRESYFIMHDNDKVRRFTSQCQSCLVTNALTGRKMALGMFPMPSHPFHTIYLDILENLPGNHLKINNLLIASDALSKNVYVFPLKDKTSASVLAHVKTLLMMTNMATQYLVCDNGPAFREKKFVAFMSSLGIEMPLTTPNSSKSRGAIEIQVKLISNLLKKLLLISPSYDFGDVYFLSAILLNNSYHPSIGAEPASVLYGSPPFEQGPLGTKRHSHIIKAKMLNESLRPQVEQLRKVIAERVRKAMKALRTTRAKVADAYNKAKKFDHGIVEGDVVFIVNHSLPPPGSNAKLRPVLYKSPYVTLSTAGRAITCMRLTDGVITRIHVDHVRKYSDKDALFEQLPAETHKLLGQPLTSEALKLFARTDALDLLYLDRLPLKQLKARVERPATRSQATKELEMAADAENDEGLWQDADVDNDDDEGFSSPLKVRFKDISSEPDVSD